VSNNKLFQIKEFHNCYKILNVDGNEDDKLHDIFELHY